MSRVELCSEFDQKGNEGAKKLEFKIPRSPTHFQFFLGMEFWGETPIAPRYFLFNFFLCLFDTFFNKANRYDRFPDHLGDIPISKVKNA